MNDVDLSEIFERAKERERLELEAAEKLPALETRFSLSLDQQVETNGNTDGLDSSLGSGLSSSR